MTHPATIDDDRDLDELEALLAAQLSIPPLADFIATHWPHELPPEHLSPLIRLLERARHERVKVAISWPPRHAKTVTLLRAIAWWLKYSPADTCGYITYNDNKAWSKSELCRRWTAQAGVELGGGRRKTLGEWRTMHGGGLLAAGARSGITGQGVSGLMVYDDPYRSREDADSPTTRGKISDIFREMIVTRMEGASVLVVHTRWHEDDIIGELMQKEGWEVINLPAIADENDAAGRAPGEALWPTRFPVRRCDGPCGHEGHLDEIRQELGEWSFAALYQGSPRPRGAAVFGPARFYDPKTTSLTGCRVMIGGDPAASESTRADYSVAVVLAVRGHGADAVGYVLDVWRGQVQVPTFTDKLRELSARYWHAPIAVEAVGGFIGIPQTLKKVDPQLRLVEVKVKGDKFTRAQPVAAAWNAPGEGRLLLPIGAPWLKDFKAEVERFTGVSDVHDDQVDALAHAWNAIAFSPIPVKRGARPEPQRWR